MIFATVGTHPNGFDRLVRAVDEYAAGHDGEVVIQFGHSSYRPVNATGLGFVSSEDMRRYFLAADIIVAHAGAGSLIEALRYASTVIVVPRLRRFRDHMDDHQLELAAALHDQRRAQMVTDITELPALLDATTKKRAPVHVQREAPLVPFIQQRLAHISSKRRMR